MAAFGMAMQIVHALNDPQQMKNFGARNWTKTLKETKQLLML